MKATSKREMRAPSVARTAPFYEEVWSCQVKEAVHGAFCGDGVRAFVIHGARPRDWRVIALDAPTGKRLWTYPWPARLLLAQDGVVLLGTWDGQIHVVDAATGRPRSSLWGAQRDLLGECEGAVHTAAIGPRVVVSAPHDGHGRAMLRCFDLRSGERLWTHWLDSESAGIAVTESRVLTSQFDRGIWAFETMTGRLCWRCEDSCSPPRTDGRRVFLTVVPAKEPWRTVALDLADGCQLWEAQRSVDAVADGVLFGTSRDHDRIEMTDAGTGRDAGAYEMKIRVPPKLSQFDTLRVSHVSERHVFVTARYSGQRDCLGAVLCLDRKTAQFAWAHGPVRGIVYRYVFVEDGRLIYRCGDRVYCLKQTT